MEFKLSSEIINELRKIKQKNPKLLTKIKKQLTYFKADHTHPSLRTHKLKGNLQNTWSISIEGNLRLLYTVTKDNTALFFKIGTHDEVYKK